MKATGALRNWVSKQLLMGFIFLVTSLVWSKGWVLAGDIGIPPLRSDAGALTLQQQEQPSSTPMAGQLIRRYDWEAQLKSPPRLSAPTRAPRFDITVAVGPPFGAGFYAGGWSYGPRLAPAWTYPGLMGGPYVGYPWGFPGYYSARAGSFWSNGLSLYGPPVPVYGPIPGVLGNQDLVRQWRAVPSPGFPFGWVGIFAASPRPRVRSVHVWPTLEPLDQAPPTGPDPPTASVMPPSSANSVIEIQAPQQAHDSGHHLTLSVRVPQPTAEVWINGQRTQQLGLERLYESPTLPEGRVYEYEVLVRWWQGGQWQQERRQVRARPGEVVRLDFSR
jgi:uncharacterized protein (TIGR03000 family)